METIEQIWRAEGRSDSKHILNTSASEVSAAILDEIEQGGVTLERLEELRAKGLHVYSYMSQITIHGIFPKLCSNYLGGYKTLFQNKNKSIGVRWHGVDKDKKAYIYKACEYMGWHIRKNSSEWYAVKYTRVQTPEEAKEVTTMYKTMLSGLDTNLFYGYAGVTLERDMFGTIFAVAAISINGIQQANTDKVLSQIYGKPIEEVKQLISDKEAEKAARELQWQKECEENKKHAAERRAAIDKERAAWIEANPISGAVYVKDNPIMDGQVYATATASGEGWAWSYMGIKKIGANLCRFKCDKQGNKLDKAAACYSKTISGYLIQNKKESKETSRQEPKRAEQTKKISTPSNGIKVVDYSEKAIAVIGDTKPIKETLKQLGGRFNMHLNCGSGWIFPKSMESKVRASIN